MVGGLIFIGIDDTDLPGTRGAGRLARNLADYLELHGWPIALNAEIESLKPL